MAIAAIAMVSVLSAACFSSNFIVTTARELPKPGEDKPELPKQAVKGDGEGNGGLGREGKKHRRKSKKQKKDAEKQKAAKVMSRAFNLAFNAV